MTREIGTGDGLLAPFSPVVPLASESFPMARLSLRPSEIFLIAPLKLGFFFSEGDAVSSGAGDPARFGTSTPGPLFPTSASRDAAIADAFPKPPDMLPRGA